MNPIRKIVRGIIRDLTGTRPAARPAAPSSTAPAPTLQPSPAPATTVAPTRVPAWLAAHPEIKAQVDRHILGGTAYTQIYNWLKTEHGYPFGYEALNAYGRQSLSTRRYRVHTRRRRKAQV